MSDVVEENKPFRCGICLDLVYKPIVHACGHVFCFWCVHMAMSAVSESQCAICRSSYSYFPRICELLHHVLAKTFPDEYKVRENETRVEEAERGTSSPELMIEGSSSDGNLGDVSITDLLCKSCSQLLCRPVVLNCGHAFCEFCISRDSIRCSSCADPHPVYPVQVCLELDSFIKRTFPAQHLEREQKQEKDGINRRTGSEGHEVQQQPTDIPIEGSAAVHFGAGCDDCGMYPIRGRRYRCQDCPSVGYDLCGECFDKERSSSSGRFNQQHTSDHVMVEQESPLSRLSMLALRLDPHFELILEDSANEDEDSTRLSRVFTP